MSSSFVLLFIKNTAWYKINVFNSFCWSIRLPANINQNYLPPRSIISVIIIAKLAMCSDIVDCLQKEVWLPIHHVAFHFTIWGDPLIISVLQNARSFGTSINAVRNLHEVKEVCITPTERNIVQEIIQRKSNYETIKSSNSCDLAPDF